MMDWGVADPVVVDQADTPAQPNDPNKTGVMIALIPTDTTWCQQMCPHMTLVYAGTTDELSPGAFNELGKEASDLAVLSRPLTLKVTGQQEFGGDTPDNPPVEVFTLESTVELRAMRRAVEGWNASDFPFNPHVTIGPRGTVVPDPPTFLRFDKIMVAYGDQELIFSLRGSI